MTKSFMVRKWCRTCYKKMDIKATVTPGISVLYICGCCDTQTRVVYPKPDKSGHREFDYE